MIRKFLIWLAKAALRLAGESDYDIWQAFLIFE